MNGKAFLDLASLSWKSELKESCRGISVYTQEGEKESKEKRTTMHLEVFLLLGLKHLGQQRKNMM